jgi:hypothetical protein
MIPPSSFPKISFESMQVFMIPADAGTNCFTALDGWTYQRTTSFHFVNQTHRREHSSSARFRSSGQFRSSGTAACPMLQ